MKLALLLLFLLAALASCKNMTGNVNVTYFNQLIQASENRFNYRVHTSSHIGDLLDEQNGGSWNVYIRPEGVTDSTLCAYSYQDQYLNWESIGKYNWTYTIYKDNLCKGKAPFPILPSTASIPYHEQAWGESMTETMKGRIRAAIEDAAIKYGQDMHANACHIKSKMSPGSWSVYIWAADLGDTLWQPYECRRSDNWGLLFFQGPFKWLYYIVYSH